MNRLNQTQSAVFQLCSFTVFPKNPFFRLFSLLYSLLETPYSWFLQNLRQNGVGRVFERVTMMQENNWLIRLSAKAILKESLHNQKLHRVLCVGLFIGNLCQKQSNLMSQGLRHCWALSGTGGCRSFIHRTDQDMKDITSLGKTITFQYSKSNMTNIVKLAIIKSAYSRFL